VLIETVPRTKGTNIPEFNLIAENVLSESYNEIPFHSPSLKQEYKDLFEELHETATSMMKFLTELIYGHIDIETSMVIREGYIKYHTLTRRMDDILYEQNSRELCFGRL